MKVPASATGLVGTQRAIAVVPFVINEISEDGVTKARALVIAAEGSEAHWVPMYFASCFVLDVITRGEKL
jgi:hypothetical protein